MTTTTYSPTGMSSTAVPSGIIEPSSANIIAGTMNIFVPTTIVPGTLEDLANIGSVTVSNTDRFSYDRRLSAFVADVTVLNRFGLHVRPAGLLSKVAQKYDFKSEIYFPNNNSLANMKSVMGIMTLEAIKGTPLVIRAYGKESDRSLVSPFYEATFALFDSKFNGIDGD